jgi:hypothetical protein
MNNSKAGFESYMIRQVASIEELEGHLMYWERSLRLR